MRRNSIAIVRLSLGEPYITDAGSVGNDPELEIAKLTRLLCGLVLWVSICVFVRLAISLTVLRTSSDAGRLTQIGGAEG